MGEFFDSIEEDLDALDSEHGGSSFGTDYNSNASIIRQVQQKINEAGYSPALTIDGAMGPKTTAGIKWLQNSQGVTPDGIVGDQTLGALGITPPGGMSVDSVTGAAKGAAAAALSAIQSEFAPLLSWATSQPQPITQGKGVAPGFQATRSSVVNSYVDWTTPLEGFVPHMYIDRLGFVTTGMGNLIDSPGAAGALPWKNADGSRSSQAQITAAWNAVDSTRSASKGQVQPSGPGAQGGGSQGHLTSIRITKADVQSLVASKMKQNEADMLKGLPNFAQAPADAQLAAHSQAWAMGSGFAIPGNPKAFHSYITAFNAGDYKTAAAQAHMQGTGIDMRNMANKLLLTNAAQVVASKQNPDTLFYIDGLVQLFGGTTPSAILASIKAHPLRTAGIVGGVLAFVGTVTALALRGT